MRKSKKHKNDDIFISPGKRYLYKTRRTLFALSILSLILNMSLIAVFDESMRETALITILLSTVLAIAQLIGDRKTNWDWLYTIVLCAVLFLFSAFGAFATALLFVRYIWMGEFIAFCGLVFLFLHKKGNARNS